MRWAPTDELAFTVSHDSGFNRPMAYFGTPLRGPANVEKDWIGKNYNVRDGEVSFDDTITQVKAEWAPTDGVAVKSTFYRVTADRVYRNAESYFWNAGTGLIDRSSYIAITQEHEQIGNRTDATFDYKIFGLANQTVVGFDVNRIKFSRLNNSPYEGSSSVDPYDFDPGEYFSSSPFGREYRATTNQYSLFIDDRLKLTDQISLVGGLRYDRPEVDYRGYRPDAAGNLPRSKGVFDSVSWRAGVVYEPVKNLAFYAQYSEATDPVNAIISLSPANQEFRLARGEQIEVGVKQRFWQDRAEWTLAAYRIKKKDLLTPDPNNPGFNQQVGGQSSRGIEASLGLELGRGWRLDANAAILDAKYDDFADGLGGNYKGNTPLAVPERLANLYATWNFAPNWRASGGLQYVGRTFTSASNAYKRPDFTLFNAGMQWKPTEVATLDFRVKNLTNKRYAYAGGDSQWYFGAPRTAELALHVRW